MASDELRSQCDAIVSAVAKIRGYPLYSFSTLGIIQRLLLCYTSVNRVTWELVVQSISKDFSSMISEDVIFKATRLLWKVNWLKKIFSRFCN